MNSQSNGNNREIRTCFGRSRDCVVYTVVVTISTFIFISSMFLTVYLTHTARLDMAVVVLIVGSCLLYLLCFTSNMYSIYYCKPNIGPSGNGETSHRSSQTIGTSAQRTSINTRAPDIVNFPRARELFRTTPPPPYEIQMSEISRMLLPGTSRTTGASAREAERVEETQKFIQRLYEEVKRTDKMAPQSSTDEKPAQQMVQTPKSPTRQQQTMSPKVSKQHLAVQKQQTVAKTSPGRGIPPVGSRTNQVGQQKVAQSSLPNQLDLGRLIIGSEGCSAANTKLSPRVPGRPPVDFRTSQAIHQKVTPNSPPTQPDLEERFIIGSDGYAMAPPQLSNRREGILKAARKRKLGNPSQDIQAKSEAIGNVTRMAAVDSDSYSNEYEEIEVGESVERVNSSQGAYDPVEYFCTESESGDQFDQSSSAASVTSESSLEGRKRNFPIPSVKEPRQLSALATRKFCQLGPSPDTYLTAIGKCFDLTPNEWELAWNLTMQNVPPVERARILGVRLQEDSYNVDK